MSDMPGEKQGLTVFRIQREGETRFTILDDPARVKRVWAKAIETAAEKSVTLRAHFHIQQFDIAFDELPTPPDKASLEKAIEDGKATLIRQVQIQAPYPVHLAVRTFGPFVVTPEKLQEAQDFIDAKSGEFATWTKADLHAIDTHMAAARALLGGSSDEIRTQVDAIYKLVYRLAGRAGTYGFPVISDISRLLFETMEDFSGLGRKELDLIQVHIDSIKMALSSDIRSSEDETAKTLMEWLGQAIQPFVKKST